MIWKAILIPFYLLWTPTIIDHGIYITVFEIHQDVESGKGQVVIKAFSDDLVSALRAMNFNIPQDANPCDELDFLSGYVDKHLLIKVDGEVLDLEINQCTVESDTHWIYFGYEYEGEFELVEVNTDWMTELFGNQQNIIRVKSGDQRLNDRLDSDRLVTQLKF